MSPSPRVEPSRLLVAALAACAAALAGWMQLGLLEGVGHVKDEVAYLFQAGCLERLSLSAPRNGFSSTAYFALEASDRLVGAMPNGWPAVLALAHALGLPYGLINPLLLGALVVVGAGLAAQVAGERARVPAALLLAFSPQMLLLGASTMNHTLVALTWAGAWALALGPATAARGLALGALIGLCFLTRPLCGAVLGVALLAACPRPWARWAWASPTLGLAAALQLAQNLAITGDPLQFPINLWFEIADPARPEANALGFGPGRGTASEPGHSLPDALANTWQNLRAWGLLLLGPGLAPLGLLGLRDRAARPVVVRWLAATGALIAVYGLYWYVGTCYGARFYHGAAPLLLASAAIGLAAVERRWLRGLGYAVVAGGLSWSLPRAAAELDGYWLADGRLRRLAEGWARAPAVVLVEAGVSLPPRAFPLTGPAGLLSRPELDLGNEGCIWMDRPVCFARYTPADLAAAVATGRELYLLSFEADATNPTLSRLEVGTPR